MFRGLVHFSASLGHATFRACNLSGTDCARYGVKVERIDPHLCTYIILSYDWFTHIFAFY